MFLFHKSSGKYYALCGFGGVLSCGLTHTLVTPLDLVKCRLQVNKEKYKSLGKFCDLSFYMFQIIQIIIK